MKPARLQAAAASLGAPLDNDQADLLIRYVGLLEHWNAKFNLISRRDIGRIWPRHILDSLSIAPLLRPKPADTEQTAQVAFDIGTGAGLPGLPLAIALPEISWRLIDRNRRKVRFLETVISQIGLGKVSAAAMDLGTDATGEFTGTADFVVSRAVDEPAGLLSIAEPLLKPSGRLVLMTGADRRNPVEAQPEEEGQGSTGVLPAGTGFVVTEVCELSIPGLDRTHEVTIIEREPPS